MIVSPSFLTADFSNLEAEIRSIQFAKWLHFDVMDGRFVPNYTYNQAIVAQLKKVSKQFFDVHLMIENPGKEIAGYANAGADLITFHLEASGEQTKKWIDLVKSFNIQCGISIKPGTDPENLIPYLPEIDLVLVMSVEPGKGGQKFMDTAVDRIRFFDDYRTQHHLNYKIEVDGGINAETIQKVKAVGCDVVVAGSFIFNRKDRKNAIKELENDGKN
jgi:ribulose-phosphate 3-epimerase